MRTGWVVVAGLLVVGCARQTPIFEPPSPPPATARSLAALHRDVDSLIDARRLTEAAERLGDELDAAAWGQLAPELARPLFQDLCSRLATVELLRKQPSEALRAIERGLARGPGSDAFTANLHVLAGEAHAALGEKEAAISAYGEALAIDARLLDEALRH